MNNANTPDPDQEKIRSLVHGGFPKPEEIPLPAFKSIGDLSEHLRVSECQFFEQLTYSAVHVNKKSLRTQMKREVGKMLLQNRPLPVAVRAWLIYVLGELDDIPHESVGAPIKDSNLKNDLLAYIRKSGYPIPRGQTVKRLKAAADQMCASYETVRAIFYSDDFRKHLDKQLDPNRLYSAEEFLHAMKSSD